MTEPTEEGRWLTHVVMGQILPLLELSGQTRLGFAGACVCGICLEAADNLPCLNKIGSLCDTVTNDYDLSSFSKASSTLLGDGPSGWGCGSSTPPPATEGPYPSLHV